jgi:hypothetical protein
MRVSYQADPRFWLHVPAAFPTEDFAGIADWEGDVTVRYAESRPQADLAESTAALDLARAAQRSMAEGGAFGLQFWPFPAPLAGLVRVEIAPPLAADADLLAELVGDLPLAIEPSVDPLSVPGVGEGIVARFIAASSSSEEPLAGIGLVVSGPRGALRLRSDPLTTTMVGLMDAPLRELASTLRLHD